VNGARPAEAAPSTSTWTATRPPGLPSRRAWPCGDRCAHGETKTERSHRTLALPAAAVQALRAWSGSQAGERLAAGGRLTGHRAGIHHPPRRRPGRGQRPQEVQTRLHRSRHRGQLDTARAPDLIRQPAQPPRRQHRGDRPHRRTRLHPHHRDRLPPRTTPRHHHRRRDHGPALHKNPAPQPPRTRITQPRSSGYLTRTHHQGPHAT
jgi:hypothetical protein